MQTDEKENSICPCCGHKIIEYSHKMNKTLVMALGKLYFQGGFAKISELDLNNTEFGNFQKLRYFGLIEKLDGKWCITNQGIAFFKKQSPAYERVITVNGNVIRAEGNIYVDQIKDYVHDKEFWQQQVHI